MTAILEDSAGRPFCPGCGIMLNFGNVKKVTSSEEVDNDPKPPTKGTWFVRLLLGFLVGWAVLHWTVEPLIGGALGTGIGATSLGTAYMLFGGKAG